MFSGLRGELERLAGELAECREERRSSAEKWEREKAQERQRITFQVSHTQMKMWYFTNTPLLPPSLFLSLSQLQSIEASHSQEKEELITQHNIQLETHQTDRVSYHHYYRRDPSVITLYAFIFYMWCRNRKCLGFNTR